MGKQWKQSGEEDKFIKKLFRKGELTKFTKPGTLLKKYPTIFGEFTPNVVRNHLNSIKRDLGLFLGPGERSDSENDDNPSLAHEENMVQRMLAESPSTRDSQSGSSESNGFDRIVHLNFPAVCQTYIDPVLENKKVLLVVGLPGGCKDVKLALDEEGLVATIKYSWPKSMYVVDDLFQRQLARDEFNTYHPMVLSLKKGLAQSRKKVDEAPEGIVKVTLPIRVQTDPRSRDKWGVARPDGTYVFIATFTGIINEYAIKKGDEVVTFHR